MKTGYGIALLALAVACISLVPALAADATDSPKTNGPDHADFGQNGGFGFGGSEEWMLLVDDATKDNFENMTVAEIKALKEQKTQELENMTLAQIKTLKEQKALEAQEKFENMTLGEIKELRNETRSTGQDGMGPVGCNGKDQCGMQGAVPQGRMGQGMDGNSEGFAAAGQNGLGKQAVKADGGDN